jgi:pimeloyl-ACP methyl ester carboxylesterase
MLLLHCGLGSGAMWKAVVDHLGAGFAARAPDLPGHGRSPGWGTGDVHTQATETVRPFLREGTRLVGHSFGATVALRLALEVPWRISGLTLVEPVLFAAARGRAEWDALRAREAEVEMLCDAGDTVTAARVFHGRWGGGAAWERLPAPARNEMARKMPFIVDCGPSLWDDRHGLLAPGGLERIACPVGLVRGAQTQPVIADIHGGLMARLPQARETVVQGAGHMAVATHPAAVAEAIRGTE